MPIKSHYLDETIFKKYDIRGIVGKSLSAGLYNKLGKAYVQFLYDKLRNSAENIWVSVGWDARLSSPEFAEALISGLRESGINVLSLGLCPTPLCYFSEFFGDKNLEIPDLTGSVTVTASHNPAEYNGLKFTYNKSPLSEDDILSLKELVKNDPDTKNSNQGKVINFDIKPAYIDFLTRQFRNMGNGLKVVVDSGNATAGIVAPELYRNIGCEVIDIFSEPDGRFPNHHPDPLKEENLGFLKNKVLETNADFGISFDGDSDRICIVDENGKTIPGDQLVYILMMQILSDNSNWPDKVKVISEVKCSQILYDQINKNGGEAIMWKTGHSFIKEKMKKENALLAGEMSGHIFFKDRYFGYDDAIYAGCRFIEILNRKRLDNPYFKVSDLTSVFNGTYSSPEIRIDCPDEVKFKIIEKLETRIADNLTRLGHAVKELITIDGIRIVFDDGFGLVRASNTEPALTLRFEFQDEKRLKTVQSEIKDILDKEIQNI